MIRDSRAARLDPLLYAPGGSVHGERANFTRLVLGCIEADCCNKILVPAVEKTDERMAN